MLIGLTGRIGSGKTTIARHLVSHYGFTDYSFATPIKEMICVLTGCSMEDLDSQTFKDSKPSGLDVSYRTLLQTLGTEWGRNLDPDFWLKVLNTKLSNQKGDITVSDVRFDNEAELIREKGGVIIHIYPSLSDFGKRNNVQYEHQSEKPIRFESDTDFILINKKGSFEKTIQNLSVLMNIIRRKYGNNPNQ